MARAVAPVLAWLALVLVAACRGPAVPHPLTGQSRYLCCNLFYEKTKVNDANYQVGTMIPFGTRVQVLAVYTNAVTFQGAGQPPIEVQLRFGRGALSMSEFVDRLFVADDPHTHLRRARSRRAAEREEVERINAAIAEARVEKGMTREEVLMAVGYPPAHRTPSLDAPAWTYWTNRFQTFIVRFDGDRVSSITR